MDIEKKARAYLANEMDKHGGCQTTEALAAIKAAIIDSDSEIARLRVKVERLDDGESQAIKERDHAEKIIGKLCDAVLGTERAEWSSGYYFEDAVDDVETAIYRLRAEADALRVDAERYRWLRVRAGQDDGEVEVFIDSESWAPGHLDSQIDDAMGAYA